MSPRKTILRELARQADSASQPVRPSNIPGFSDRPDQFQKAVNDLLQARLVEGHTDQEGRMTIAINQHRAKDVQRELRPIWSRPVLWVAVVAVLTAVGATLGI